MRPVRWRPVSAVASGAIGPHTGESVQGTTGSDQPTPGNDLNSTKNITWSERHKLNHLSYVFVRLRQPKDETYWRNTPQIQIPVKGRKITWLGQAVATFTRNVVAIVYDILRVLKFTAAEIDEDVFAVEHAHANQTLALTTEEKENLAARGYGDYATGSHIRYGADLTLSSDDSIENVFGQLKTVMGEGWIYSWKNKWRIETGREKAVRRLAAGPARITGDDLVAIEYQPAPRLTERFNGVRMVLEQSMAHDYEQTSIEYIDATARSDRDFGLELPKDIGTLTALSDPVRAQRIASTVLERGRKNAIIPLTLRPTDDLRWLDLEPNDVVELEEAVIASYTERLPFKGRVKGMTVNPDWSV